jgi:hypothetical protein
MDGTFLVQTSEENGDVISAIILHMAASDQLFRERLVSDLANLLRLCGNDPRLENKGDLCSCSCESHH